MAQQPPTTNHRPPPLPATITFLRFELPCFRSLPEGPLRFLLFPRARQTPDLIYPHIYTRNHRTLDRSAI